MLCYRCGGTKKYFGNGMILTICTLCNEKGHLIEEEPDNIPPKIDRRCKSYQNAIKEIMDLNPEISYAHAVKMFTDAYEKV